MIKDYSDFIKPIREIIIALIEADYKTIESQGWASAEHAERVVNGARRYYLMGFDSDPLSEQKLENPPKGLYWLIVTPDEKIKENLKENAFLIDTLHYDKGRFPLLPDDPDDYDPEFSYYLDDVIDGKTPITDSTWHISIRLISQRGMRWGTLLLEAMIKDNSLSFRIVDTSD